MNDAKPAINGRIQRCTFVLFVCMICGRKGDKDGEFQQLGVNRGCRCG